MSIASVVWENHRSPLSRNKKNLLFVLCRLLVQTIRALFIYFVYFTYGEISNCYFNYFLSNACFSPLRVIQFLLKNKKTKTHTHTQKKTAHKSGVRLFSDYTVRSSCVIIHMTKKLLLWIPDLGDFECVSAFPTFYFIPS